MITDYYCLHHIKLSRLRIPGSFSQWNYSTAPDVNFGFAT